MADEEPPRPNIGHRWDDAPGVFEFRLLALERQREDHEIRIRTNEQAVTSIKGTLEDQSQDLSEIKTYLRGANEGAWRNFWSIVVGVVIVVLTILGEHFANKGGF